MRSVLFLSFLSLLFCTCKPEASKPSESGNSPANIPPSEEIAENAEGRQSVYVGGCHYLFFTDRPF